MIIHSMSVNKASHGVTLAVASPIDTETKMIQNQITSQQQSLKRLSSDSEMSAREKAKERQEIEKQIAELNRKLRMLRMEKKEETKESEKEQKKKVALEEQNKEEVPQTGKEKRRTIEVTEEEQEKNNISPQNIKKILEAGTVLEKERIQQKAEQKEEAMQKILEAEIKTDELYGTDSTRKKEKVDLLIESKKKRLEIQEPQERKNISSPKKPVKIVIREDDI